MRKILESGYHKLILKCDNETSILSLREAVMIQLRSHSVEVLPEEPPRYESQSNALAEIYVQIVKGITRTLVHAASELHNVEITSDHPAYAWAVSHAVFLYNRSDRDAGGKTPYELRKGKPYRKELAPWGHAILYMLLGKRKSTAAVKFQQGIFL